jgi:hypothetical protein
VVTSFGLGEVVGNHLATGRITKWALELMGHDISYVPQMAIKSQAYRILWLNGPRLSISPGDSRALEHVFRWLLYPQQCRVHFCTTNNVAEYEALVNGPRIAAELGVLRLYIHGDSNLVINQEMGELNCCDSRMMAYRQEVTRMEVKFYSFELHHIH